jgi:prohibitin 1
MIVLLSKKQAKRSEYFDHQKNSPTMTKLLSTGIVAVVSAAALFFSSCTVVRQGEFAVKRKFGKYSDEVYTSGLRGFNPFTTTVIKVNGQTENLEVSVNIPSREGLTIQSEVSILYQVTKKETPDLLRNVGLDYETTLILPVFRSAVADVTSRYYAKDMHSGSRSEIEKSIQELMMKTLSQKGIQVEAVLLKSIVLPRNLTQAIEDKLEAEQRAQRMEFVLQQEKQEAERKRIQAQGVSDANKIISAGLSQEILQFKALEAWLELSKSPNAKVIISNGSVPMMMDPDGVSESSVGLPRGGLLTSGAAAKKD